MRHLIDTYIKAEEARTISDFGDIGLLDLIVKSGIAEAIASLPEGHSRATRARWRRPSPTTCAARSSRSTSTIRRFTTGCPLLAEVLADLKAQRIDYEEFLKRIAALAAQVQAGKADDTPEPLKRSPGLRAIYNLLAAAAGASNGVPTAPRETPERTSRSTCAQRIDAMLRGSAPDGWRGILPKEQAVKRLIYEVVQDDDVGRAAVSGDQGPGGILMAAAVQLGELRIEVVRKDIKNVHLSVYPPAGRVRIAAPRHLSDDAIRAFAIGKLGWIRTAAERNCRSRSARRRAST